MADAIVAQRRYDLGLRRFMINMFNHVGLGVLLSGIVAMLASSSPELMRAIYMSPMKWIVMFAPLAFIFWFSFNAQRMSVQACKIAYYAFSGVMGLSLGYIFLMYSPESIMRVFFITSIMYFGSALYGYTTQRDMTSLGSFFMMGLIGIIVASVVNIFLVSSAFQFMISVIGVIVFTGLTAYDVQRAKHIFDHSPSMEEAERSGVLAAFSLYLNFINLFQMLLHLLGNRE
mgnify:CR=1 FL=1|jgi:FtsH-binding integral membrane protein